MRPAPSAVAASLLALLAAVALAPAASAAWGLPDSLTPRGKVVEDLFGIILLLGALTFVVVFVWLVAVIWRFREGSGHGRATHEKERHNTKAEAVWIGVPLVMVLAIGVLAYAGLVELDHGIPREAAEMQLRITGSQWNWMADYGVGVQVLADPDLTTGHVEAGNAFLVPQDTNILFNITSTDVIHAFHLIDANRAYVVFSDANPLGQHRFNLQMLNLPAGNYSVQCKEFCFNPGHAYMHATLRAVPKAEFQHWLAGKQAEAGAKLSLPGGPIQLQSRTDGLHWASNGTLLAGSLGVATGTRVVVEVVDTTAPVTLRVEGVSDKTIPAGEKVDTFYSFDAEQPGTYLLTASRDGQPVGGQLAFRVVTPDETRTVRGLDYRFDPADLNFQAGKTYLVQLQNVGGSTHDLHIGQFDEAGGKPLDIVARSASASAGATVSFIYTPTEKGTFELWCSPHAGLGMRGTVTVT